MLTLTPPMGWNSWNTFGVDISDRLIRESADALVASGLKEAGYNYVVIDDGWSKPERDEQGRLAADEQKFPFGIKALSNYIHSLGLKFGMYSCCGVRTCAGYLGSFQHEFIDARTFADWNVDFLKYDYCYKPVGESGELLYRKMSMALRATGKDILLSACNWGLENSGTWMRSAGAGMYRSTGDIVDNFQSVKSIALSQVANLCYSGPGCFNDLDMLVVGMYGKGNVGLGGCSDVEYRSHFALWCLFHSPLMIGGDVRSLSSESLALLKNRGLIAINQDADGRPPFLVNDTDGHNSFAGQLSNGDYAFGFFNMTEKEGQAHCVFSDVGLPFHSGYAFQMEDVLTGQPAGTYREFFQTKLEPHDCRVYRGRLVEVP